MCPVLTWTWLLTALVPVVADAQLLGPSTSALVVAGLCLVASSALNQVVEATDPVDWSKRRVRRHVAGLPARPLASLLEEWEHSERQLTGTAPGPGSLMLTLRRAALLDELEARDPVGFATWQFAGSGCGYPLRQFIHCQTTA